MSHQKLKFSELSKFSDVCNFPPPTHINYRVREPHMSHMGINVCAHCPLHLPKKVSKKQSVNHIGSSTSHQKCPLVGIEPTTSKSSLQHFPNWAKSLFGVPVWIIWAFIKSCYIDSRNKQSPKSEVMHETNKAHFRNLPAGSYLAQSVEH